jgi:putative Ig domain-containing protein
VTVRSLNVAGIISTGLTQDFASTLTAFSKVGSLRVAVATSGVVGSLTADQVASTCRSDTRAGSANIVNGVLDINGHILNLPQHPSVDQAIPLPGLGTLTLNQQIPATGGGVEVQAAHLHLSATSPDEDLYLGVSVCSHTGDIGNTITVTSPGAQTSNSGTAITPLHITATDTDPGQVLTYSATGLPAGLSINATTGVITGTPTTGSATPNTVTVTATDTTGASGSATFDWTINNVISVTNPGDQLSAMTVPLSLPIVATDSDPAATLSYSAIGLPAGLSINSSTGVISGTPTTVQTTVVTITVADGTGASHSVSFNWTITLVP